MKVFCLLIQTLALSLGTSKSLGSWKLEYQATLIYYGGSKAPKWKDISLQVKISNLGAGAASLRTATSMEDLRGVCVWGGRGSIFLMLGKRRAYFSTAIHTSCHEAAVKAPWCSSLAIDHGTSPSCRWTRQLAGEVLGSHPSQAPPPPSPDLWSRKQPAKKAKDKKPNCSSFFS